MADKRKDHKVQVMMNGFRYIAAEMNGTITISRDGGVIGKAKWADDQLVNSSAVLPDNVTEAIEKLLKEQMDNHWGE